MVATLSVPSPAHCMLIDESPAETPPIIMDIVVHPPSAYGPMGIAIRAFVPALQSASVAKDDEVTITVGRVASIGVNVGVTLAPSPSPSPLPSPSPPLEPPLEPEHCGELAPVYWPLNMSVHIMAKQTNDSIPVATSTVMSNPQALSVQVQELVIPE